MPRPKYLGKRVSRREVDYNEIDDVISTYYGHRFEVMADQEWGNYESHPVDIKKEPLDRYDQEKVDTFKATGKGRWLLQALLTDMANNGVLAEADYEIRISY